MGEFSRRLRGLQFLFPSSGTEISHPHTLGETVTPVIEFPGKTGCIERGRIAQFQSGPLVTNQIFIGAAARGGIPGGTGLNSDIAAPVASDSDFYIEIIAGDLAHDSATARQINVDLRSADGLLAALSALRGWLAAPVAGQPSGREPFIVGAATTIAAGDRITSPRPVIIPPGFQIQFVTDTAAAAFTLTVKILYFVHPIAEPPLLG